MQIPAIASAAVTAVPVTPVQSDAGTARASSQASNVPANTGSTASVASQQQVQPVGKSEQQPNVEDSVKKLNDMAASLNTSLQFSVDPTTKMEVVKVVDASTKEIIRQIPSQEVIDIAKAIDKFQGMLVRDKA